MLPLTVIALVVLAAAAHASWNVIAKSEPDRLVSSAWLGVGFLAAGIVLLPITRPPAPDSVPYLLASGTLQTLYLLALLRAYLEGDFGLTYPMARGLSPLVVGLVSVGVLHEHLALPAAAGLAAVCAGLVALALSRGLPQRHAGVGWAVLTGLLIAAYSLADGVGVRHSDSVLGYTAWLFVVHGLLSVAVAGGVRREALLTAMAARWRPGVVGGLLSVTAYAVVLWAQARAPLAAVSTLREVSVVFAVLLARVLFAERLGAARVSGTVVVAGGVIALALAH